MISLSFFVPPKATWLPSEFAGGSPWITSSFTLVRPGDC
ncbi:hypothetical protein QOV31_005286 (plasmid) [Agrobacterium fabrum]|nr:hypothetical protein QOV31_005286 [Agrobacterium fabrum]